MKVRIEQPIFLYKRAPLIGEFFLTLEEDHVHYRILDGASGTRCVCMKYNTAKDSPSIMDGRAILRPVSVDPDGTIVMRVEEGK